MQDNRTTPVPVPAPAKTAPEANGSTAFSGTEPSVTVDGVTVDPEVMMALINSTDENGHTPCAINVSLEDYSNIQEGKALADYTEDERTYIDGVDISECSADLHSFDDQLMNLVLTFESPRDAYLRELNELLNRYRIASDDLAAKESTDHAPVLTVTIVPMDLKGRGVVTMSLPTLFCRILSDNNENCSMLMQFHMDTVDFFGINMTDEEASEITADVMRQEEMSTGGQLFDEPNGQE